MQRKTKRLTTQDFTVDRFRELHNEMQDRPEVSVAWRIFASLEHYVMLLSHLLRLLSCRSCMAGPNT